MPLLIHNLLLPNAKLSKSTINTTLSAQHIGMPPPSLFFLAHMLRHSGTSNHMASSLEEDYHNLSSSYVMLFLQKATHTASLPWDVMLAVGLAARLRF